MVRGILASNCLVGLAVGLASGCGSGAYATSQYGTLTIVPSGSPLVVTAGETVTFAVQLVRDEPLPTGVEPPPLEPVWSVTGDVGAINASTGVFTATQPASSANPTDGSVTVTTSVGSTSIPIQVTVTADAVARVVISAPDGTDLTDVAPGQQIQFSAVGEDLFGNRSVGSRVALTPTWGCDSAVGAIDQNGLFTARGGTAPSAAPGNVTATAPGVGGTVTGSQPLTVTFPAKLSVEPTTLDFGDEFSVLPLAISNLGSDPLSWQVSENIAWLSLDHTSGAEEGAVKATVTRSGLEPGTYTGTITVTGSDGTTTTVGVVLDVTTVNVVISGSGAAR